VANLGMGVPRRGSDVFNRMDLVFDPRSRVCNRLFLDFESICGRVIFLVQIFGGHNRGSTLDVLGPICTARLMAYQIGRVFAGYQSMPKSPR
jgi:hypothetical protein